MTGRWSALLTVILLAWVLSACQPERESGLVPGAARIDVDTPELRALRDRAGVEPCATGSAAPTEGGLPAMTLPCLGGGDDVDLSSLEGPLVVNLWASWCGPCREELPVYQRFYEQYGDRVAVLGVDYEDTQPRSALELVRESGVTYPLLADPQSALSGADPLPSLRGLPFLALIDAEGEVVHQEFVRITSVEQLAELVDQHLGVPL